ncbi:MAG: 16S rRNA (guanine(527)-N(7))-methyltransferase RsmG [Ruminococcus sp.]|nr:16S rRNA (guanine(527)-N(7))-methyltransferase RsmG [Ruminococcus sp.]
MDQSFKTILDTTLKECGLSLEEEAKTKLEIYDRLLSEYNQVMNLTALTEPRDVALKHFCDSLTVLKYAQIPKAASVIDVGTGAGFPGLVLKIARPDLRLSLLDSLQKRLSFLEEVCRKTEITDVRFLHNRAEDGAREVALRETYDFAISRAVAPLNVLCEYCLPYVRVGGIFLAMKGKDCEEELSLAQNAIRTLGGEAERVNSFELVDAGQRAIIQIRKITPTPESYPRTSKKIKNNPL